MDKKEPRDSVVPLGTFASSVAPPRPDSVQASHNSQPANPANPVNDDAAAVQTRAVRSSAPAAEPSAGESERKRIRTLLGVPTPSVDALASAARGSYPSPPKWQRAGRDDAEVLREGIEALPVARIDLKPNRRLAGRAAAPMASEDANTANISEAIQQMLDEQSSVSLEVEEEATPLDLLLESELQVLPDSVPPVAAAGLAPVVVAAAAAVPSEAEVAPPKSVPVLVPEHVAQAHAREHEAARATDATVRTRVRPEFGASDDSFAGLGSELDSGMAAASSLAPAELNRPVVRDDAAPALGFMMVAAMALLAVGGWLFTAGGYERVSVADTRGIPAAAAQPVPPAAPTLAPTIAPVPAPAPAPPAAATAPQLTAANSVGAAAAKQVSATGALAGAAQPRVKAPVVVARKTSAYAGAAAAAPSADTLDESSHAGPVMKITTVGRAAPAVAAPEGPLPELPSRDDVLARLEGLRTAVQACAEGKTGVAELDITIAGTGAITTVVVGGDFAGTPQGSCIARAVRQAHFPRFQKERFRLLFPYSI